MTSAYFVSITVCDTLTEQISSFSLETILNTVELHFKTFTVNLGYKEHPGTSKKVVRLYFGHFLQRKRIESSKNVRYNQTFVISLFTINGVYCTNYIKFFEPLNQGLALQSLIFET